MPVEPPRTAEANSRGARLWPRSRRRTAHRQGLLWRRHRFALRLAGCFIAVTLAATSVEILNNGENGAYYIWVANGLLLAYLLLAPRWRWPAYLSAGFAAYMASTFLSQQHWQPINLFYNGLDIADALIAALLLRRRSAQLPRFTNFGYIVRFISYAVVAAPVATGLIYTLVSVAWLHKTPANSFLSWGAVDSLGIVVVTPACVAIFRTGFRKPANLTRSSLYLALLVLITLIDFTQSTVPLLLVIYPLLVLILLEMGLGWAALSTLFVAVAGGWFSFHGIGSYLIPKPDMGFGASLRLQVFAASATVMLYIVSVVLEKQRAIEKKLRKIVAQHSLVLENSRDVIVLSDFRGNRSYVSSSAEFLTGWTAEELLKQSGIDLVHPDDLPNVKLALRKLRSSAEGSLIECRIRAADGRYIWVESSLCIAHDPETGAPSGILNMIRDIEERKHTEEQLASAYRTVEALAVMDPLTGLSNRRRFDQCLTKEWRRALRDKKPLSMLLIDADLFKSYNDSYGHPHGDSCLKQIAKAALEVVTRPSDLVARIGGEEFAIILPNTRNLGAMQVATALCEAMRRRNVTHKGSPYGIMTISVGCATLIPRAGQQPIDLIEKADSALYQAKSDGRNRVCNGSCLERAEAKDSQQVGAGGMAD